MVFKYLLLMLGVFRVASGQWNNNFNEDCRGRWRTYWQCVNYENGRYSDRRFLTSSESEQLSNEYQRCFQEYGCGQAFDGRIRSARRDCFSRYKRETNTFMQKCMQKKMRRPFDLPDPAYDPNFQDLHKNWLRRIVFERNFCPPESRGQLAQCIDGRLAQANRRQRESGDECQNKRYRCGPKINDHCYRQWNDEAKRYMRECFAQWSNERRESMKSGYTSCVNERTDYEYDPFRYDDSHYRWLDHGNLLQRYVDRREPCGGQIH